MLRRVLAALARTLLVFVVVWLVVVGYWHYTRRVVSSTDLVVWLGLLPGGLTVGYWAIGRLIAVGRTLDARRRQTANAQANAAPPDPDDGRIQPLDPPVLVIGSALASGLGDAGAWIERTRGYAIHHVLDEMLSDALGWPLRSIRLDDVDEPEDPTSDETTAAMRPGVRRAARLLDRVLGDLDDVLGRAAGFAALARANASPAEPRVSLHPEWNGLAAPAGIEDARSAGAECGVFELAVHLMLPAFVDDSEAEALGARCRAWALRAGWPPESVTIVVARTDETRAPWALLGEWIRQQLRAPQRVLVLLSALSWIDELVLADQLMRDPTWAERLRRSATVVGEVAAGIVLTSGPVGDPATGQSGLALARLSRLALSERRHPVDVKGSVEAELLDTLAQGLVRACGVDIAAVRRIVATGDFGDRRPVELGKWLSETLPHLSLVDDSIQVGTHLGQCDPASDLAALVLAVESCREVEAPVLCCSNHSGRWRGLSAVLPVAGAA